jgi:iron complex outermembrane receptor protein
MTLTLRNPLIAAGAVATLATAPAFAAIEVFTVTAERTEGSLQEVPIAVTAISEEKLDDWQITEAKDLQRIAPSLNMFGNVTQPTNLSLSLRGGLQQDASLITAESPVGIYIDDIFVGRLNGNNVTLSDIERVEVLRGPQGTLYGRNTAYGAIRFITRNPGDELWLNAGAGVGNDGQLRVKGSVGGPFNEDWGGSLSAQYSEKDGQFFNVTTNEEVGAQENLSLRGKLRYTGNDKLDAILSISYSDSENDSNQMPKGVTPNIPSDCTGFPSGMCDPAAGEIAQFTTDDLVWVNGEYGIATPNAPDGPTGPSPIGDRPRGETEQTIAGLTLSYDINDRLTVKSITGYVGLEDYFHTDFSGNTGSATQFFGFTGATDIDSDQFTQEFQVLGSNGDRLEYLAGVFYLNEDASQNFGWNGYNMILGGTLFPGFVPVSTSETSTDVESIAVYGEARYNITERLKATAGLRWTEDDKDFTGIFTSYLAPPPLMPATTNLSGKWDEWTPKVALDYILDTSGVVDSMMLYGSASRGFKGGGFSAIVIFSDEYAAYGPETNWTYAGGMKAEWFGSTLRTNLEYFFSDVEDIQQNATVDLGGGQLAFPVQNSGDAEIQGLEYEILWSPIDGLNVFLSGNFLDGEYKNLDPGSAAGQAEGEFGLPAQPPQVPDYTLTIGFDYTFEMPGDLIGDTSFGFDYYEIDDYMTAATNDFHNSGWDIWNGFVSLNIGDSWEVRLTGKNLGDDVIVTSGSRGLGGFIWLPPREYLFQVNYRMPQ